MEGLSAQTDPRYKPGHHCRPTETRGFGCSARRRPRCFQASGETRPHSRTAPPFTVHPRGAGRPARADLSLDAGLLSAIDEAAAARGLTRSAFLAGAAREKIESGG